MGVTCLFLFNVFVVVMGIAGDNRDWKLRKEIILSQDLLETGEPQARTDSALISLVDASASPKPLGLPSAIF